MNVKEQNKRNDIIYEKSDLWGTVEGYRVRRKKNGVEITGNRGVGKASTKIIAVCIYILFTFLFYIFIKTLIHTRPFISFLLFVAYIIITFPFFNYMFDSKKSGRLRFLYEFKRKSSKLSLIYTIFIAIFIVYISYCSYLN